MENKQPATSNQQPLALALASAALLILAFPNFGQPWAAWVALVPWLLLLRRRLPAREAFGWSWLIGFVFFLGSMWWLVHLAEFGGAMALLGCGVLCAYLALFFGGFGWLVSAAARREGRPRSQRSAWGSRWWLWFVPAAWVGFEYARSHLLSGFGWNLLAYSQSPQLGVIQVSDLAGAWAVSFLIVLVNVALADMAHTLMWAKGRRTEDREALTRATLHTVHGLLAWLVIAAYGSWRLDALQTGPKARVAVVQGSIPQEQKWDAANRDAILRRYDGLAKDAAASRPDLIVWPETAVPGLLDLDDELRERVAGIARAVDVPMLVGAPMSRPKEHTWLLTNSAALITAEGRIAQRHDKLHLVPFGEFVPGERLFPWLRDFLPPIGEFVPGTRYTVFDIKGQGAGDGGRGKTGSPAPRAPRPAPPFSVLICFEDIFPNLARRFVREGARLLFVITNDAWFGPTAAAYQHAQASTFRAVELRVPVIRAANTGRSGCIDASGLWLGSVRGEGGRQLFVPGTHTCSVPVASTQSVYARWGDWFALLCLLVIVARLLFNPLSFRALR
jgi:apolipoprotein N-acyltransferase